MPKFCYFSNVAMPSAGCWLSYHVVIIGIASQLIFSVPLVLLYSAYWVFPESSRWLLANGRVEEAEDIVREIARCQTNMKQMSIKIDEHFPFRRTNGRVLPAQWRLLPPSKSSRSEGFNFEIETISNHFLQKEAALPASSVCSRCQT